MNNTRFRRVVMVDFDSTPIFIFRYLTFRRVFNIRQKGEVTSTSPFPKISPISVLLTPLHQLQKVTTDLLLGQWIN